ncbi:MAG: phosphatase PAP2 family protein [Pseudomonadales bacterium]|nr:phosphatase PAP2 family protein [Pseudomonadales bacterium]
MLQQGRSEWAIAGIWVSLLLIWKVTAFDTLITGWFFDPVTMSFPQARHWFWESVMHDGVKDLVIVVALATLFGIFYFRGAYRRALLFAFGSMIFTTTVVAIIKYQSNVACPWDMAEYGGDVVAGAGGGCWPSGHASTGYCLFALFFAARWLGKDYSGRIFAGVMMLGTLLSVSQTVRGAHFLSHGMWTGVIIWTLNCLMARIWLPVSADDPQAMGIVCQPAAAKVAADYS